MHILFVNSVHDLGGGLTSAVTLASALAHAGHDVTLVCNAAGGLPGRAPGGAGIDLRTLRFGPDFDPFAARRLAGIIRDVRPDVVLADRRKDVKLLHLARIFGGHPPTIHRHGAPSTLRDGWLYRRIWRRLDAMVVNSHAMRRALLRATPWLEHIPVHVVHNGVDTERFRHSPESRAATRASLGIPDDAFVIACPGVLQARKRVDLLLRAAAQAAPAPRVLVVGDGPDRSVLEDLADTLGVPATFTDHRTDLPGLLVAADIAAHLSSAEGFSNAVLECLACGLPVIATAEHSHPEQIDDGLTGLLVPPSAAAVTLAIQQLRHDHALRAACARAARETALRRFTTEAMARGYESVFIAASRDSGRG